MPHNISIRDGRPAIFVTEIPAWHGLGTVLQEPATAAEAMEAANLNWTVSKQPVYAGEVLRKRVPKLPLCGTTAGTNSMSLLC